MAARVPRCTRSAFLRMRLQKPYGGLLMLSRSLLCLSVLLVASPWAVRAEDEKPGKVRVLLLGDSTVIGSACRDVQPKGDHLEDVVRKLLAADAGLPPVEVVNRGQNGDMIHQLLARRYEKDVA